MDFLCKTMEEATGLSFLNGKYYKGIKVTFHIHEIYPGGSADNFGKAINIDKDCFRRDGFLTMVHELVHILHLLKVGRRIYTEDFSSYIWRMFMVMPMHFCLFIQEYSMLLPV